MIAGHWLLERVALLVPLILSLTVHEWAHAYSAFRLGDNTAERQGRLTLDPLKHIDLIGTILLPLTGIPFGWAKPVPVNPQRFRRGISMRGGLILTSAAGPASNVVLALLTAVVWGLLLRFAERLVPPGGAGSNLLQTTVLVNIGLAVFNLLPIPPLDGGRVVDGMVPPRFERQWQSYCRFSPFLLLAVILSPNLLHISVLGWPMQQIARVVAWVITFVAGEHAARDAVRDAALACSWSGASSIVLAGAALRLLRAGPAKPSR